MINILQIVISLLYSQLPDQFVPPLTPKSVAVIGAGSAGLAMLKALFDLPETTRDGWRIVLYEQRGDVGGVWKEAVLFSPPNSNFYQASRSPSTFTT
jgi:cation diffusion facilitator CzcD-associated flavoprotein CzcO